MTELEIGADGRIYIFGASPKILNLLSNVGLASQQMINRLECIELARVSAETDLARANMRT